MKKIVVLLLFMASAVIIQSQDPYIRDVSGLGVYGYLEYNATTFADLDRNTHGNVKHLGARWWVDGGNGGQEYVYWTTPNDNNWQCNGNNSQYFPTNDYNPIDFNGEWIAGTNCYVSVYAEYCDGSKNPNGGTGAGYNERHFQVIDVDNAAFPGIVDQVFDADGDCAPHVLVGSFTIDPGSLSGISLTRFWFENIGSAQEGTDIPNDGFTIFYEQSDGSETFESDENSFTVTGLNNSDNVFGTDNASALLNGKTRFYVALCDLTYPAAHNTTVELKIINDGISLSPSLDNHNLLRINETNITNKSIQVPITLIDFKASITTNSSVILNWTTTNEINNSHFTILHSKDSKNWKEIGRIEAALNSLSINEYSFADGNPFAGENYYKLEQEDKDGQIKYYGPVFIKTESLDFEIYPNPVDNNLWVMSRINDVKIEIINSIGSVVKLKRDGSELNISGLKSGVYRIIFRNNDNSFLGIKSFIKK